MVFIVFTSLCCFLCEARDLVFILLRYVCRFLFVQVKRYTVQMAIPEKLTSLVRVPISLSVKNYVSDDVMMPALWLPER